MARAPKQKLLTTVPQKFDPDFIERLDSRCNIAAIVHERRAALEAHCGSTVSYVQGSLVKRCIWLELICESYEQKLVNGEPVDVGALTQLNNSLKGLYKDLGLQPTAKPVRRLRELIEEKPENPRYLTTVRGFGYRFEESA